MHRGQNEHMENNEDTQAADDDFLQRPLFSRTGTSAIGKCTAVLKTHIPEDTDAHFKELARRAGCTPSELLRDLVCLVIHDQTFGEITAAQRRAAFSIDGQGPQKGLLSRFFQARE